MIKRHVFTAVAAAALAIVPSAFGQTTVGVTVGPEATFVSTDSTTTLSKSDTTFGGFGATTNFVYKIRTSQTGGAGAITLEVTAFTGTGGPAISDLSYTCSAASSGTACSTGTPSISAQTSVVTFGTDAHSADTGDAGSAVWTLADRTTVKTGTYSTTATFTISAT
jgi:hypothetical protein